MEQRRRQGKTIGILILIKILIKIGINARNIKIFSSKGYIKNYFTKEICSKLECFSDIIFFKRTFGDFVFFDESFFGEINLNDHFFLVNVVCLPCFVLEHKVEKLMKNCKNFNEIPTFVTAIPFVKSFYDLKIKTY